MRLADLSGLLAIGAIGVQVASGGAFLPPERLVMGGVMALVAVAFVLGVRGRPEPEELVLLAVVAWAGACAVAAASFPLAAREMVGGWLVTWLVWVAVRRVDPTRGPLMVAFVAAAALTPALAIVAESLAAGRLRTGGLYLNPNVAAALLVPAIPALWGLVGSSRLRFVAWAVAPAAAAGVVLSGTRAGLIAMVVVAGLMIPRGRLRVLCVAAAAVAAVGFVLWRFSQSPDSLAWHRLEIWRALWPLVVDHPVFGVGPGWLEDATGVVRIAHEGSLARWGHVIGSAESTPYGLVVRTGLIGFGVAAAGVVLWCRRVRCGTGAAGAVAAGIAVLAAFHDYLMVDVVLWWWAALLGATLPIGRGSPGDAAADGVSVPAGRMVAGLAAAMLILWTIAQPAWARRLWWSEPPSTQLAERALRAEPWLDEPSRWRVADLLTRPTWAWEDAAEALLWSRRSAAAHPGSFRVWTDAARVQSRVVAELGPWPDAVAGARTGYRRATELEPHLPWAWLQWAQLERSLGQSDRARELAERAVAEEPNFVRGWLLLARLALDGGDLGAAGAAFREARTAHDMKRPGSMTRYERDLLAAPSWQVEEIGRELATRATDGSADADLVQ